MVASDTVVGLVGAGILLVALVGVFVYESQQGSGTNSDLVDAKYASKATGTINHQAPSGQGVNPATGQCLPMAPAGTCTPARTTADITLTGLPSPGSLHYVVFLEGGSGSPAVVGEAQPSGKDFKTGAKTVTGNHAQKLTFVVSLESSGSATTATWKICSQTYAPGTININCDVQFVKAGGNHSLSIGASGSQTSVDADLNQVPVKMGFTYRGWMVKENDTGLSYVFVGNFTSDDTGNVRNGTIMGSVPGARLDYTSFIVTYEDEKATIGIKPAGPAVITANYNPRASPTVAK